MKKLLQLLQTMPKSKPHLPQLIATRKQKTTMKYPPSTISLQVLGTSLYLFTDQSRYLFNCGEGTQRLAHEHKNKLAKLDHVFLTSGRWERVGGLMGVSLTVQDIGVERLFVHGPPGVNRLFSTARRFIILNSLEIKTLNSLTSLPHNDHILSISYINIHDGTNTSLTQNNQEDDPTDYYSSYRSKQNKKMITIQSDETVLEKNIAVQYGIHFKAKEGQLLIDKCVERGVPPGPLLGRLKAGEDIVLGDGRVVKSEEVRGGGDGGVVVLVLDCPTPSHLPEFLSSKDLASYQTSNSPPTHTVVHFTPLAILNSPEYKEFLQKFPISTTHLIINEGLLTDAHEAVHRMQTKLNVIDGGLFPIFPVRERKKLDLGVVTVVGETGGKIGVRGSGAGGYMSPPWTINHSSYTSELSSNPEFLQELTLFKTKQPPPTPTTSKLIFLGTGSSIPNKTRNVSSFYLQMDANNSMLFDCGEGTMSQLLRFQDGEELVDKLKIIYISHLHADHHLGLFSFLKRKKLIVIAPRQIASWLEQFSRDFEHLEYDLMPADGFMERNSDIPSLDEYGISKLSTCLVKHCPNAFGVSVVLSSGKKLTYSGDTLPCEGLVNLGMDSDILVHEATMEDGLEKDALLKMHSTISQAIDVGKRMNAGFTILTHFSQRYSKIPLLGEVGERVGVAFDGLVVGVGDVGRLGGMGSVLKEGWREDVEEMEERKVKRGRREEREMLAS